MTQHPRLKSVRLRVRNLDQMASFYKKVLGLSRQRHSSSSVGLGAAKGEDEEPIIVLEEAPDAPERPRQAAGLFHLAIRLPTRHALSQALRRLETAGYPLSGASDHLVSQALYLRDPEGNGIELYWDRPKDAWPTGPEGQVRMDTLPLDLDDLRAQTDELVPSAPGETDLGHVHLEVTDPGRIHQFCRDVLGMNLRTRQQGAVFLAWGDYHHHIAANTWRRRSQPVPDDALGLVTIGAEFASRADAKALVDRADDEEDVVVERGDRLVTIIGPDAIRWEFGIGVW